MPFIAKFTKICIKFHHQRQCLRSVESNKSIRSPINPTVQIVQNNLYIPDSRT